VVLVNTGAPPAGALPGAQTAPAAAEISLADCWVRTNYLLNLRAAPTTESAVLTQVPFETMLQATVRSGAWLRVTYGSDTGWLNEAYLALVGSCG
ncbi:SH3 domain-containing protein, partial [Anaerolineae bacterium CFX9]|nr:SH3 domain-containing protein [Anaerolineae bacterium CFX9]